VILKETVHITQNENMSITQSGELCLQIPPQDYTLLLKCNITLLLEPPEMSLHSVAET
jgi:hypothetical protein